MNYLFYADNMVWLEKERDGTYNFVYIDPPFNTGSDRVMNRQVVTRSFSGNKGFQDNTYSSKILSSYKYTDNFDDYMNFLAPRLIHARRILSNSGTLCIHLDYREVHYVKVFLDYLFGRERFLNEIIWAYDYGGRGKRSWPKKHDTILVYTKTDDYIFRWDDIERIPYMAPLLVTEEKRERGKVPTDVWWNTIVPTNSKERTGYPTQKPIPIIKRLIRASSNPMDTIVDFFAGSGTSGIAAHESGRSFILVDSNREAINIIKDRLNRKDIGYEFSSLMG